jgi:hypothetical protein
VFSLPETEELCKKHQPNLPIHLLDSKEFEPLVRALEQKQSLKWSDNLASIPADMKSLLSPLVSHDNYDVYSVVSEWNSILIVPCELNVSRTIILMRRVLPVVASTKTYIQEPGAGLVRSSDQKWHCFSDEAFFFVSQTSATGVAGHNTSFATQASMVSLGVAMSDLSLDKATKGGKKRIKTRHKPTNKDE